jgi:hypothetical protein
MNLYKLTTIGLITGVVVACGAAGSDLTPVARADEGAAGSPADCACVGQAGPQGAPGPQGPAGPAGKDAVCASGLGQCPTGVPGPAGADGVQGADGSSCSVSGSGTSAIVACTNGTVATITAPTGLKGDAGERGETGAQGVQGFKGDQGPPGTDGSAGLGFSRLSQYTVMAQNVSGGAGAEAACKDSNDVLVTGGCQVTGGTGYEPIRLSYPVTNAQPNLPAKWVCGSTSSLLQVVAVAVCVEVP